MFYYKIQKRLYYIYLIILLIFLAIVIRIFYVQVFKTKNLSELANNLWSRNLPILSDRGLITDRNGVILADNITTTSLVIIPNQISNKEKVAEDLAKILNTDYLNIYNHVTKRTSIERIHPEGRGLSYETAEKISALGKTINKDISSIQASKDLHDMGIIAKKSSICNYLKKNQNNSNQ